MLTLCPGNNPLQNSRFMMKTANKHVYSYCYKYYLLLLMMMMMMMKMILLLASTLLFCTVGGTVDDNQQKKNLTFSKRVGYKLYFVHEWTFPLFYTSSIPA